MPLEFYSTPNNTIRVTMIAREDGSASFVSQPWRNGATALVNQYRSFLGRETLLLLAETLRVSVAPP